MPLRSPPPLDAERVRALLAPARSTGPEPGAEVGDGRRWLPEGAPPEADTSWADEVPDPGGDSEAGDGVAEEAGRHRAAPRVLTIPVAFRGAHLSVSWRAVMAVAVLLVLAGLVFAVRVARAEQAAAPEAVGPTSGLAARTSVPAAFSSASTTSSARVSVTQSDLASPPSADARGSPTTSKTMVIDVVGQVARPGVVSVSSGSRVADVLAAAGGLLPSADVPRLNLARLVADGEQVFVPRPGENPPSLVGVVGGTAGGVATGLAGSAAATGGSGGTPVDLNQASLSDLDTLPGVGPVLAQRIIDWRSAHGRFSSVDELAEVSGIGDKLLAQLRPKVRVS